MSNGTVVPALSSQLLRRLAEEASKASVVPIESTYLPIGPLTFLHALAVSHGTLLVSGYTTHSRRQINLVTSTFLDLMLLFGSVIVSSALLAQPSPILLAPNTVAIYAGVHAFNVISGLGKALVSLSGVTGLGTIIDVLFAVADAICRSDGIAILGVESVRSHSDPLLASSTFAALTIGTIVGAGGFLLIGLLSLDTDNWSLRTPSWLSSPSLLLSIDLISSFLAAALYHYTTSPTGSEQLSSLHDALPPSSHAYISSLSAKGAQFLQIEGPVKWTSAPLLRQEEAKALCAMLLFFLSLSTRLNRGLWSFLSPPLKSLKADVKSNGAIVHDVDHARPGEKGATKDKKVVRKRKSTKASEL